jgi:DMSO/TMAO reductase YedYZ molybdopterin-dependent catalytic subunit
MKNLLLLFLLWSSITIKAQSTSETLTISGVVQKSLTLKIDDLNKMKIVERKDFKVVSTSGDIRKEFKTYKAVLLKDLLEIATINLQNPKEKGKLYVVATATDGYNAIFSYHEIFNNPVGDNILVVFEVNGKPIEKDGAFVLISTTDKITGARHVKWLNRIEVKTI